MDDKIESLTNEIKNILDINNPSFNGDMEDVIDFLNWTKIKANFIFRYIDIDVPKEWLPSTITVFQYEKFNEQLAEEDIKLINTYYIKKVINNKEIYLLDKYKNPTINERYKLADKLIFQPKHVVWVDFGYNIGCEFSGKHPALILKNIGDNLIVVPLSSQEPVEIKDYHVKVDKVFNLKKLTRWINIHRIVPISVKRIDYQSPNGDVKREIMGKISVAIEKTGIK